MRVILWDIDGTLVRMPGVCGPAWEQILRSYFPDLVLDPDYSMDGKTDQAILRHRLRNSVDDFGAWFREHGESVQTRYAEYLAREVAAAPGLVLPGVREVLERLDSQAHGCEMHQGVLTGNFAAAARAKLAAHDLLPYFPFGSYGSDCEDRNALLPVALERFHSHTGLPAPAARDVVVVGDTPHDVAVARAHGALAVAVATGRSYRRSDLEAAGADVVFDDLSDVERVVEALLG